MIIMIDNYDSFTYNLVQALEALGREIIVYRNDQIRLEDIEKLSPSCIVISPGPGVPSRAGISIDVIRHFGEKVPILGVCLGHQAIAEAFGAKIIRAPRIMHGKSSLIYHDGKGIYYGIPNPFEAVRYHSLIVDRSSLPAELQITAWTDMDEIMGIRHKEYPIEGVQFHPESIMTKKGNDLLRNFVENLCCK